MSVQIKPAFMTYLWISFFTVDRGSWPWVSTFRNFILPNSCSWGRPHLLSNSKDPPLPPPACCGAPHGPFLLGELVHWLSCISSQISLHDNYTFASDHWVDMSLRVGFSSLSLKFIHFAHGELVGNGEAIPVTKCRPRHPTHKVHHRVHLSPTWKEQEEVYCLSLSSG